MKLTIAVPTFNRPVELAETIAAILPQLTDDTELIVLDNASPSYEVEAVICDPRIRIIRHRSNTGAIGNVLRCFEEATSNWLWVLGDDDDPMSDSVQTVLAMIGEYPDALSINFNSTHGPKSQDLVTLGRIDLIDRFPSFGNLLFLSTNVYRIQPLLEHLHMGYRFGYSMAPHLVMLISAAGQNGTVVFRNEMLVQTSTAIDGNHWSAINYLLSIPTLLELPLSPTERKRLASRFQMPGLANQLIQLLGTGVRRGEFETSKFYYRQITGRVWPYTPLSKRIPILLGYLAFTFPSVSLALANWILVKRKGSSVMARLRAETDDPRL